MIVLTILAALVALGCALACTRRLYFATHPTALHPAVWRAHLERGEGERVARLAEAMPEADWERELLGAAADPNPNARTGRINEQVMELEHRLSRWARVPRVCASVASSAGFLFGSLTLRFGLVAANDLTDDLRSDTINTVVLQAVNVAAFGVAGAAFAIAAQYRARKAAKAFQRDADTLIDALEQNLQGNGEG